MRSFLPVLLLPLPLLLTLAVSHADAQEPAAKPAASPTTAAADPLQAQAPVPPPPAPDEPPTSGRKWPPFGLAIGAGVREIVPTGDSTDPYATITPIARFVPRNYRAGLVPAFRIGLGKQRTTVIESVGGGQTQAGTVFVRPFTAGLGWSQPVANRLSMVFAGTAGYAWNGFDAADNGRGRPRLSVPAAVVDIGNSFAWELSGRAWLDLTPRVSLMGGVSFLSTHPDLTLSDGSKRAWNANQVRLEAGVAFTVLKPKRAHRP